MKSYFNLIKRLWLALALIVFNTVIFLILLEYILSGADFLYNRTDIIDEREKSPVYSNAHWSKEYWQEHYQQKVVYEPYVLWTQPSFSGNQIVIDDKGHRRTIQSKDDSERMIFFFGGSTMWGTGSPDTFTIPSYFMKFLDENGETGYTAVNFGQSGYTYKQELLTLINEIQRGNVPDTVIFYDGVNDVFAAYQSLKPGLPQNNDEIRKRLEGGPLTFLGLWFKNSGIMKAVQFVSYHFLSKPVSAPKLSSTVSDSLASGITEDYKRVREIAINLGRAYGFKTYFFLQPNIFSTKKRLDDYEKEILKNQNPALSDLYKKTYQNIASDTSISLFDVSGCLDTKEESIFIDFCHVGPEGNKTVAETMFDVIKRSGIY